MIFVLIIILALPCVSSNNKQVKAAKASSVSRIALVLGIGETLDDLKKLASINPSKYSFDVYAGAPTNEALPIDDLWTNLNQYRVLLIDEDAIYNETYAWSGWDRDNQIANYYSFYNHKNQLALWIKNGGGLFVTCNNDAASYYVWSWLPDDLQVVSDEGAESITPQIVYDPGLFSYPNKLDQSWVRQCGGHWHGSFVNYPGYMVLVQNDQTGQAVEIYRKYGSGVVVLSHAEFEAGLLMYSYLYVENEIYFAQYTGVEYSIVFVPMNWKGSLDSFYTEVERQANFIFNSVRILQKENTKILTVNESLTLNFDKNNPDMFNGWATIREFAIQHGVTGDRYVAVTNEDIWGGVVGLATFYGSVVVYDASTSFTEVTAHELAHTWGLLDEYNQHTWEQEANYLQSQNLPVPNTYPGYDGGRLFDGKRCIMGYAGMPEPRAFCPECYPWIDRYILETWGEASAALIEITMTFYRDGRPPKIEKVEGIGRSGKSQRNERPGIYSVQLYDEKGNIYYDSNITYSFMILRSTRSGDIGTPILLDEITVSWLAPIYSTNETVKVAVKNNISNETIFEKELIIYGYNDLFVASMGFTSDHPKVGETAYISTTIRNVGTEAVKNVMVKFYIDGVETTSKKISSIEANSSKNLEIEWIVTEGSHIFVAVVDPDNQIIETDETNNQASFEYTSPSTKTPIDLWIYGVVVIVVVVITMAVVVRKRRKSPAVQLSSPSGSPPRPQT